MTADPIIVLNSEQQDCVDAHDGVYVVNAGPGSGKTTTLLKRYFNMIESGIASEDILNLTFTSAAAEEMARRAGILDAKSVFRTFHSFGMELLKKEKKHLSFNLSDSVIPVAGADYQLLFELSKQYPINFRILQNKISAWKRTEVMPAEALENAQSMEYYYAAAYELYEKRCRERGWLDFDSIIQETVDLLEYNEEVRNRWKRKYISVDECQDTDVLQFRMLKRIFDGNIFCVGDSNQLIYEWRNAQADNLTNFSKTFPGAKTLFLGKNYRSTQTLVDFFKEILPVDNGIASHMVTDNDLGNPPTFIRYSNEDEEAEQTLASITDYTNSAVLARTNRQLFRYQKLCTMRGIKYRILGKKDFWEQPEIKKLLALAKNSKDSRSASVVLTDLISSYDLIRIYENAAIPGESNPIENLNEIVKLSANRGSVPEFLEYLRRLTFARKNIKGLTLSTVHQAKGREFKDVYVIGVDQDKMPHKEGETAEERRIFFVACSRAAKSLTISFCTSPSIFIENYSQYFKRYFTGISTSTDQVTTKGCN